MHHALCLSLLAIPVAFGLGCSRDEANHELPIAAVITHDLPTHDDGTWAGVSEGPDGTRFALHTTGGLYRFNGSEAVLMADQQTLVGDSILGPTSAFHDLAAMGDGRFALVADNDGFLFDHNFGMLTRLFCYVPSDTIDEPGGWGPDPVPAGAQRTLSLDYDAENNRIVAQPQTYHAETGEVLASHVATFDGNTGLDQEWFAAGGTETLAGGLVVESENTDLLGLGTELLSYDRTDRSLTLVADLDGMVGEISGLARTARGSLLITDVTNNTLTELDLSRVED